MKNKRFNEEVIKRVFEKYKLGKIKKIEYSKSGIVNPCLFINDKYVLRVNVRDPDLPKFRNEKIAMSLMRKANLPVPKVLGLDESKKIIPYSYIITSKIKGNELKENWSKLSNEKKKRLSHKMGVILAKLHKIKLKRFGNHYGRFQFSSWETYILKIVRDSLKLCKELNIYKRETRKKLLNIFKRNNAIFKELKIPSLVHYDYSLENTIYDKNEITGIVDFEWSIAGDPVMDFKGLHRIFENTLDYNEFVNGYKSQSDLPAHFEKKLMLYKLFLDLHLSPVSKLHWSKEFHNRIKHSVLSLEKKLNKQ